MGSKQDQRRSPATDISLRTTKTECGQACEVCPICLLAVTSNNIEEHTQRELRSLDREGGPDMAKREERFGKRRIHPSDTITSQGGLVASGVENSNRSRPREKRKAAVHARKYVQELSKDHRSRKFENNSNHVTCAESLKRVRDNRQRRRNRKQQSHSRGRNAPSAMGAGGESPKCPVCGDELHGSNDIVNDHIDRCLLTSGDSRTNFSEYTVAGQHRVRPSSLLDGGYTALPIAGSTTKVVTEEEDCDIDIEDHEETAFGEPVYSERDLVVPEDLAEEGLSAYGLLPLEAKRTVPAILDESVNSITVEALKEQIRMYQTGESNTIKCLVCLEVYKTPVVSTVCWHVHCEKCWLRTLGVKRLCPQCNVITSPADLRKIYV